MNADDERWDIFLEAYARQAKKLEEMTALTQDILSSCSKWLDEVPREWWIDFYTLTDNADMLEEFMEEVDHG